MKEADTLSQENNLELAIEAIRNGEVVGIPTETVYGIGVDPYSQTAVDKIFSLKERREKKPLSILISSFHEIQKLNVTTLIPDVVELYWPGPLTIIVKTSNDFANGVGTKEPSSIGVRVPENELAINLIKQTPSIHKLLTSFTSFTPFVPRTFAPVAGAVEENAGNGMRGANDLSGINVPKCSVILLHC